MKKLIENILLVLLSIAMTAGFYLFLSTNTILNKNYILKKLEKENYYDNVYELTYSNFENYIYQSGFEKNIIEGVISKQKIKNDVKLIIDNFFYNSNIEIDTEEIKINLLKNIENEFENGVINEKKQFINEFIEKVCNEYKATILNFNINTILNIEKLFSKLTFVKNLIIIFISIDFLIIIVLNLKSTYKLIIQVGKGFVIHGGIILFISFYMFKRIKISTITILNDVISEIIRKSFSEFIKISIIYSVLFFVFGIILIIIGNILKYKKTNEK